MQENNSSIHLASHWVKGMNNESCMSPGWLAAAWQTAFCVNVCMPLLSYSSIPPDFFPLSGSTTAHTQPPPPSPRHHGWDISPQQKCPHFNLWLRWSPGPSTWWLFGSAELPDTSADVISAECNIIIANKDEELMLFLEHFNVRVKPFCLACSWSVTGVLSDTVLISI